MGPLVIKLKIRQILNVQQLFCLH